MGIGGYASVCVQLYCVGFHCFTTCFGLNGYLQVCRIFYFHKLGGKNTNGKKGEDHVKKGRKKSSEAESFKHMEIKFPTRLEDGHVGRNM
jgi:hypothetical protein